LLILLFWVSHEKVLSTTHLLGNTRKPRGGMSLYQSTFLPSLAHSLAQILATFSEVGFRGLRTMSILTPKASSAQRLPLPS
jgi:hypothetical protein